MEKQLILEKSNLFIVDDDYYYSMFVKYTLEKKLGDEIVIKRFSNMESCFNLMKRNSEKLSVLILDLFQNKQFGRKKGNSIVDQVQEISPDTSIIMLSDKKNLALAKKALTNGAHDLVIKDQFAPEHIFNSVEKCLRPVKM